MNLALFIGPPAACAAALKTLEIHNRKRIWRKARKDGKYLLNKLKEELSGNSKVKDIRGIGMEIGVEFNSKGLAKDLVMKAYKKGLFLVKSSDYNIQIMPPLTMKRQVLDVGIEILIETFKKVS